MTALNLYSLIESDLDFTDEIAHLYHSYIELLEEKNITSLIDIGCGQGDFLLLVQDRGISCFGVDLSSEQIEVSKSKGLDVENIDISKVNTKYQCATAVFDVLNYLDKKSLKHFIQSTYNVLEKDGYFIFDINSLYGFDEVAQGSLNISKSDKFIAIDAVFEDNKLYTTINLFEQTNKKYYNRTQDTIVQYYHSKEYLVQTLEKIGFEIEQINEFYLHDQDIGDKFIFVCTK